MILTPVITSKTDTACPVRTESLREENKETISLAKDTLRRMPLLLHEIDSNGFSHISGRVNLDKRFERKNDIEQYMGHFYTKHTTLRERLNGDIIDNLNKILKDISVFCPPSFVEEPLSYIIQFEELKTPHAIALIHGDPLITLNLITARGCGLYSDDYDTKRGALHLLTALGKCAEHALLTAKEINKNTINNLLTLSLIRNILEQQKGVSHKEKTIDHIRAIDSEFEEVETKVLKHCKKLQDTQKAQA